VTVEIEIDRVEGVVLAARLENGRPTDLLPEPADAPGLAGAIFLGRVARVDKRAGVAFLDLGTARQAAVPLPRDAEKAREGAAVAVQVTGEAREDKGPPATLDLALPGRFLLRTPRRPGLSLSKRLDADARRALEDALAGRLDEGWTVRTAATAVPVDRVLEEAERLDRDWRAIAAHGGAPPALLHPAPGVAVRTLLDTPDAAAIRVGDAGLFKAVQAWARGFAPDLLDRLAREPTDIADRLPDLLDPDVPLPGGGSMAIEPTRALVAVDVDAGSGRDAAAANLAAAAELPRQLRLRNLGGLVVVDFIPAGKRARGPAFRRLAEALADDPARVRLAERFTTLGLAELTRQRRGFSLAEAVARTRGPDGRRQAP
jgi:ribonuclease E/ribonuclease G